MRTPLFLTKNPSLLYEKLLAGLQKQRQIMSAVLVRLCPAGNGAGVSKQARNVRSIAMERIAAVATRLKDLLSTKWRC